MRRAAFLGIVSAIGLAGCGVVVVQSGNDSAGSGGLRAPQIGGTDCEAFYDEKNATKHDVLEMICGESLGASDGRQVEQRHRTFDDRHPDQVIAALNVVDGATTDRNVIALGMSTYYAQILDMGALSAGLATMGISERAKKAFVKLVEKAKPALSAKADKLDPRRKQMYVNAAKEVVAKRAAYFQSHAAEYQKLDALLVRSSATKLARKAPQDLVTALGDARGAYLASCTTDDCRFEPFVIEVTRELTLLHTLAGEPLLARAESSLLQEPSAGRHKFSVETGTALYRAMTEERHAFDQYEAARGQGVDEATLKTTFGDPPPVKIDPITDYIGSDQLPDVTTTLGDRTAEGSMSMASGIVVKVADAKKSNERGEPLAEIAFKDIVTKEDLTSCYETGKVTGASFDVKNHHATLQYETICNVVGSKTNIEKTPPITVPKTEAAKIQPGENLLALVAKDSRQGVVVKSFGPPAKKDSKKDPKVEKAKTTPVLQVRGQRIGNPR